jgi:lipid-A-disaccharide synthase
MTAAEPHRLALVAGEASGDLLAGLLMGGLKARWPTLQTHGIGGPRMVAQGLDAWWPSDQLAVRGYVEVLRHYRSIKAIRDALGDRLLRERPTAFVGVDAPDFNLGLEARLKAAGIRTVHFVCPSIWAWRGGRAKKLSRSADHVLCLFPFEPDLLRAHGVAASYVGHPLADAIPLEVPRAAARQALHLAASDTVIALLPGSRRSEIEAIAPVLLAAAANLSTRRPGLRFVLPVAPGLRPAVDAAVQAAARAAGPVPDLDLLDGQSHAALAACDLTLIASGTATLEAALFKRPMVITYRMHPLSWALMKRMAYQPWVGLPNILSRSFIVPELIQERSTPQALADEALRWLDDPARGEQLAERLMAMHRQLRQNTAEKATHVIAQLIDA